MKRNSPPPRIPWFKTLRIGVLLLILAAVALTTWTERYRSTRWKQPLFVALYPLAADDSSVTRDYVASLEPARLAVIDGFFSREAARYGLGTALPFKTRLQPPLADMPPQRSSNTGVFATIIFSIRLRYWAARVTWNAVEPQDIRIFVLYHDPALTPTVPHSLGLTKGLIGVVYAFATPLMDGTNAVVIAHELLHTVGATDKYDASDDAPRFPDGYGDPDQQPLYPQRFAELMAGRRMLTPVLWIQPESLDQVVIGPATANEIRWPTPGR